jgi:hypothetical protein
LCGESGGSPPHSKLIELSDMKKGAAFRQRPFLYFGVVPRSFWNVLPDNSAALARASIVKSSFQWRANEVKE